MRIKGLRRGILAVGAAAMLGVAVLLGGCSGADPTETITADVESRLDLIKDTDSDEYKEIVDMLDTSLSSGGLDVYGITAEEVVAGLFDGYSYEVTDVEVDKEAGEATAKVDVTCKSLTDIEGKMYDLAYDAISNPDLYSMSEDELNAEIGRILQSAFDESEPRDTDIEITYTEKDGEWTAVTDPFDELANCFI